jgi:hypothetical protein
MNLIQRILLGEQEPVVSYMHARFDQAEVSDDMRRDILRSQAADWTEKVVAQGNEPTLIGFLDFYPEWQADEYFDLIEAVIETTAGRRSAI